jgi:hypothetical protein
VGPCRLVSTWIGAAAAASRDEPKPATMGAAMDEHQQAILLVRLGS